MSVVAPQIHAQNAAGLTFKYKNTVSAMSDNTAPWAAVLHDGPAPPESSDQHVFDLIGLSGNCVEVHWGGGFRDSIGNDPANNNIERFVTRREHAHATPPLNSRPHPCMVHRTATCGT